MKRSTYTIKNGVPLRLSKPKYKKHTIYVQLSSPVYDVLIDRSGAAGHKGPTIAIDLSLYYGLLKNIMAELWEIFGADEISTILQVIQAQQVDYANLWVWMDGGAFKLLEDEFNQTDVCAHFEVDAEALLHKVKNLTQLQLMGLLDFTIVWWRTFPKPDKAKKMIQPFRG